ncbi:TPA: prolipoprotein diacylglyceryl transferase [Candidatus Dependentiae bacterium]|nr:MAG: Prolipoprotein diacylglyceryl transferase [candidate division TM6 bacterium GW2011_GWE2_31_21]KKP53849.1 MAG: Prolipoprotein diacylglyceryl transferase [candidate division TM6 bacterium GW2011_GWF2_33_332]HBS47628.1 prolipoprotein diacylglyceryl transferase [Candidatus Dependentiae bacterium]HBZ73777.1 prolipoprotein diacylglyceryl transferase [Candidatus Dependentiae bacterium]
MYPRILHIYGPLWINSYGVMIALGVLVFAVLTLHNPIRKKIIDPATFFDSLFIGLLGGIVGGRLLYVLESYSAFMQNPIEIFYLWDGGFSLLGSIITILLTLPFYLKSKKVPVLPFLDLITIYVPLLQSISRIGCFLAGCCYGMQTCDNFIFAVHYKCPQCLAPLNTPLHPTQLYSSFASFMIFIILQFWASKKAKFSGQILFTYLFLEGFARFFVDFWRGDRNIILFNFISFAQIIAIFICIFAVFAIIYLRLIKKSGKNC